MTHRRRQTRSETQRARQLRDSSTCPEQVLWNALRNRHVAGLKFRRQFPIGRYFAVFVCVEANLVVELDGESHEGRQQYDAERTIQIESYGFRVFRVTNDEVLDGVESVAIGIAKAAGVDVEAWLSRRVDNSHENEKRNE